MPHPDVFWGYRFLGSQGLDSLVIPKNHPMVVAEGPKIHDVQCIWGRIFVSLEKISVF